MRSPRRCCTMEKAAKKVSIGSGSLLFWLASVWKQTFNLVSLWEALTVHSYAETIRVNSVVCRYAILPAWKALKYQEFNVCLNRWAERNSTVKNMNGGVLREYSSFYRCKKNPSKKSIHNEIKNCSKSFDVKQDWHNKPLINHMWHRAVEDTK